MTGDTDTIDSATIADPAGGDQAGTPPGAAGGGAAAAPAPPPPPDYVRDIAISRALADLMKPIETAATDLFALEKQAARDAIVKSYRAAFASDGTLRVKMKQADKEFDRAAADMLAALDSWTPLIADPTKPLGTLLKARAALATKMATFVGAKEKARTDAQQATKDWAARHADWSAPEAVIGKIVDGYLPQINTLSAAINTADTTDAPILSFWLEVAPRHLQISDGTLSANAKSALNKVTGALKTAGYDDLADWLDPAKSQANGAVHLIDPDALDQKRKDVFAGWKATAETQAAADYDFKLDPDDIATLKAAWDKLKGDVWIKDAKASLTPAS